MRLRLSKTATGAYCEESLILASVPHQAELKVRAAASLGTPAARPVMAGSDQRYSVMRQPPTVHGTAGAAARSQRTRRCCCA
jgi:hypothetical protein